MKVERIKINDSSFITTYCLENPEELSIKSRPGVLIFPGGAYAFCSKKEGEQVALAFNNVGFNAFVLEYTCLNGFEKAYEDGINAHNYLMNHFSDYALNSLFVCGFSAGAHLASSVAIKVLHKPNGMILLYPPLEKENWTSMCPSAIDVIELIDEKTPSAFVVHAFDDTLVPVKSTLHLLQKLYEKKVPFESHIYQNGGHGFSLATVPISQNDPTYQKNRKSEWIKNAVSWMEELGAKIQFYEKNTLKIDDCPEILKRPFKSFFDNEIAMRIIEESYPNLYTENKENTSSFPLAGILIYTRKITLLDLNVLATKLSNILK